MTYALITDGIIVELAISLEISIPTSEDNNKSIPSEVPIKEPIIPITEPQLIKF